jgi:glutathione peroxidase
MQMMKLISKTVALLALTLGLKAQETASAPPAPNNKEAPSFYQFKVKDINDQEFDFATLKGKKVMIVNTASMCGFTPQYEELQNLYEQYKEKDFIIIAFPANNFMMQESGSNKSIAEFCMSRFGITFPLMSKISVKGNNMHPVYQFLTQKSQNGVMDSSVKWNFQKYLINEKGVLEKVLESKISPLDQEVIDWLKG